MATVYNEGDRYVLSKLDVRVLVSLLRAPMSAYQVARQCEADQTGEYQRLSDALTRRSLRSLESLLMVRQISSRTDGPGKPSKIYKITSIGREILGWEVESMKHQLDIVSIRKEITKKHPS